MTKNTLLLIFALTLGLFAHGQSTTSSDTHETDYVAIQNQSGIQVSYVYDNPDNPTYFFVKLTNNGTADKSVDFLLANQNAEEVSRSYAPIVVKAGESFLCNDMTMAIPVKAETKLADFSTSLTIQ